MILFLGNYKDNNILNWLKQQNENLIYEDNSIDLKYIQSINPDFVISYNYKSIIGKKTINFIQKRKIKAINLHISYLPYNRGSYPNVWSFLKNTPKGISIHDIDSGIDSGDILCQKKIIFDENQETLKSSYHHLQNEIFKLFQKNWDKIKLGQLIGVPQKSGGSFHYKRELNDFIPFLEERNWDISIESLKKLYYEQRKRF